MPERACRPHWEAEMDRWNGEVCKDKRNSLQYRSQRARRVVVGNWVYT